jgi:hypothetical protein
MGHLSLVANFFLWLARSEKKPAEVMGLAGAEEDASRG